MIEIRPARVEDLEVLREMAITTHVDTFAADNTAENMAAYLESAFNVEQVAKEFAEEGSAFFIAWEGGRTTGFARVRLNDEAEAYLGKNTLELQRLYVRKEFLGMKIGSRLMQHVLDFARSNHFEWLWLGVWERNYKAQEFYKRWGFTRFSEHLFQVGDDPQTDWLLKFRL